MDISAGGWPLSPEPVGGDWPSLPPEPELGTSSSPGNR